MVKNIKRLWIYVGINRRKQFALLLWLMLLASIAETLSIGTVLPFLGALTAPERTFSMPIMQPVIHVFNCTEPNQLIIPLTIIFGLTTVAAGAIRILLLWASTRLSFATGADISIMLYRRILYQPYEAHCARNSSEVVDGVSIKANGVINNTIFPILTLISSGSLLVAILVGLLIVQPVIALITFAGFGIIYMIIVGLTRKQLLIDGQSVARKSSEVIKSIQEGVGGIRDVLIDSSQEVYCEIYRNADSILRRAQGNFLFISAFPRYAVEALSMLFLAILACFIALQPDGIASAVPTLGVIVLGAQRILPVMQQAYGAWAQIKSGQATLKDALEILSYPIVGGNDQVITPLSFKESISLNQLSFRYGENSPYIIDGLSLAITKGSRIGFIGTTGSGKSTLLDIIMGLLMPTSGSIAIDGKIINHTNCRAWQSLIAHVPQVIFLTDSTVAENIAFGIPKAKIDYQLVHSVAKQAQIAESIEGWPNQYQTLVGERGIRLSGGQRQRIGIARALYKKAEVIVFDEATSALDAETERAVMNAIDGLSKNLTILMVAHRLTTLKGCTQIVRLNNGKIESVGSYDEIISQVA